MPEILVKYSKNSKYDYKYSIGTSFGRWVLLDAKSYRNPKGYAHYFVGCECGIKKFIDCYSLISKKSTACNLCGHSHRGELNPFWKGVGEIPGTYFKNRKLSKRSLDFKKFLWELFLKQNRKCALTGLSISFKDHTASLDRIDSTKGYTRKNVQWTHKDANLMKNHFSQEYFIDMCEKVVNEHKLYAP